MYLKLLLGADQENPIFSKYSNLPNNRVGPFNCIGSRFLRN